MTAVLYISPPSNEKVKAVMRAGGELAMMATPRQGNALMPGVPWAADNGRFSNEGYPGDDAIRRWWASLARRGGRDCLFMVAPDVVGAAMATISYAAPFLPEIRALGLRAAMVAQNGLPTVLANMTPAGLDEFWESFDVLFLGGVKECRRCKFTRSPLLTDKVLPRCPYCLRNLTEWKISPAARALAGEAIQRGRLVHMGRVNSRLRCQIAASMGCSWVDGTIITVAPDIRLPEVQSWMRAVNRLHAHQGTLWEVAS